MKRWTALLLLALGASGAQAHDTWFEALPEPKTGELRLALGTGNRYPVHEVSIGAASVEAAFCRGAGGTVQPLRPLQGGRRALQLGLQAPAGTALSCWAQQAPQQLTLARASDKIPLYLDEIKAPAAVRQRWAALSARGLPWQETYTKHARIERGASAPKPLPLGLDIVLDSAAPPAGGKLGLRVLRQGQPLAQFAVELVHAGSGLGFWLRTDEAGRAHVTVPLGGDWLLRGTDLRPHAHVQDAWESDFVTLAFTAVETANGNELMPAVRVVDRRPIDDADDAQAARQRPAAVAALAERSFVTVTVLLELEWVMRGFYELPTGDISRVLRALSSIEHITLEDRDAVLVAVDAFDKGLDFSDALHLARSSRACGFATFDGRLAKRAKALALTPPVELLV